MAKDVMLSIIVPVYNVELYLDECLKSILRYSGHDIELICINDDSTDSSLEILRTYEKRYSNVKVLCNTKNSGLSHTRNVGLDYANGRFVYFLDSDDFLMYDAINIFLDYIRHNSDIDMFTFDTHRVLEDGLSSVTGLKGVRTNHYPNIEKGVLLHNKMYLDADYSCTIWQHVYKREFLLKNAIRFVEGLLHEDYLFSLECYIKAQRVGVINKQLHNYRMHAKTISTSPALIEKRVADLLYILGEMIKMLIENSDENIVEAILYEMRNIRGNIAMICHNNNLLDLGFEDKKIQYLYMQVINDRRYILQR